MFAVGLFPKLKLSRTGRFSTTTDVGAETAEPIGPSVGGDRDTFGTGFSHNDNSQGNDPVVDLWDVVCRDTGEDVFDIKIGPAPKNWWDAKATEITRFDMSQDILVIGAINSGPDVDSVFMTENSLTGDTDIEVIFKQACDATAAASTIIRLVGVKGFSASMICLT